MSERYLAYDYALCVKQGVITRRVAVESYREDVSCDFMTALLDIDIAIGDINEFGIW